MNCIVLGKFRDPAAEPVALDMSRLLETRLLVQANSGYGKSWLMRRLLEQSAGTVQQLVIDPDGEYATLRERHDYVIAAGHDGDALAHPKTAGLLARRLLETGVSAILDIYDLKKHERQSFVRVFCETLVDAPKGLWHPVLVALDEAHIFCPEKEQAEASGAVIDLATRGRKRGFALVCATQRIAKLNKDVAAELLNKLIGRTGLDVDVKRAAFELGMTPADAMEKLRALVPGEFYGFGPALSPQVRALEVGEVFTTHPKAGERLALTAPPKPTRAILAVLPKLADLPKEAEAEARNLDELRRQLREAQRALAAKPKPAAAADPDQLARAERGGYAKGFKAGFAEAASQHEQIFVEIGTLPIAPLIESKKRKLREPPTPQATEHAAGVILPPPTVRLRTDRPPLHDRTHAGTNGNGAGGEQHVNKMGRKIVEVLAQHDGGLKLKSLLLLTGYRLSGGFRNTLTALRKAGYIEGGNNETLTITDAGRELGPFPELPGADGLLAYWLAHPSFGEAERKILRALAEHPDGLTLEEICSATNYAVSGGFRNALTDLRTAGVMLGKNTGVMKLAPEIVP